MIDFKALLKTEREAFKKNLQRLETVPVVRSNSNDKNESNRDKNTEVKLGIDIDWQFIFMLVNLESYRIGCIPSLYYVPNFVSEGDESFLLNSITESGKKQGIWQQLRTRRLQCWGGLLMSSAEDSPLPAWLDKLVVELTRLAKEYCIILTVPPTWREQL